MDEEAIVKLIKEKLTVDVCVAGSVEVTLLWDGEPFASHEDSAYVGQGGPQD